MPTTGRWAIIVKETGEVVDIKLMEGVAPELNWDVAHLYEAVEVGSGVMIGMVRGGPQKAADGFGYPEGVDASGRNEAGVTRLSDTMGKVDETALPPTSHEKVRADEVGSAQQQRAQRPQLRAASPTSPANPAGVRSADSAEQRKRDAAAKQKRLASKKTAKRGRR